MKIFKHTKLVLKHKWVVFKLCCKIGIPWRGFLHDWSKFSPTEFFESIKYFSGDRSPISNCKRLMDIVKLGYIIRGETNIIMSIGMIIMRQMLPLLFLINMLLK